MLDLSTHYAFSTTIKRDISFLKIHTNKSINSIHNFTFQQSWFVCFYRFSSFFWWSSPRHSPNPNLNPRRWNARTRSSTLVTRRTSTVPTPVLATVTRTARRAKLYAPLRHHLRRLNHERSNAKTKTTKKLVAKTSLALLPAQRHAWLIVLHVSPFVQFGLHTSRLLPPHHRHRQLLLHRQIPPHLHHLPMVLRWLQGGGSVAETDRTRIATIGSIGVRLLVLIVARLIASPAALCAVSFLFISSHHRTSHPNLGQVCS